MAGPGQSGPRATTQPPTAFTGQARQAAEKALANNKNLEARIAQRLEAAGLALQAGGVAADPRRRSLVGGGLVGLLLGAGSIVLGMLIVVAGARRPVVLPGDQAKPPAQGVQRRARRHPAADGGQPLRRASRSRSPIDTIVREGTEPIASEFRGW